MRFLLSLVLLFLLSCGDEDPASSTEICGVYPEWESSDYILPYPVGTIYRVLQGNCTDRNSPGASHFGFDRYSYDFAMPIGTFITASRAGEVVFVREQFTDQDKALDQGNAIVIEHNDGTFSTYGHFTQNGVIPVLGETVNQGDTIGISGNSGASTIPHLHFHISGCLDQSICGTQTVTFRNTTPHPDGLILNEWYEAQTF